FLQDPCQIGKQLIRVLSSGHHRKTAESVARKGAVHPLPECTLAPLHAGVPERFPARNDSTGSARHLRRAVSAAKTLRSVWRSKSAWPDEGCPLFDPAAAEGGSERLPYGSKGPSETAWSAPNQEVEHWSRRQHARRSCKHPSCRAFAPRHFAGTGVAWPACSMGVRPPRPRTVSLPGLRGSDPSA